MKIVSLLHNPMLAGPHDVEVVGNCAYVAGKWGAFSTIDVSDPSSPHIVGSIAADVDNAQTILPLNENVLLLGTDDLLAIDVTDSSNPTVLDRLHDPRIQRINGMVRRDSIVFAANKSHTIDVFDVSDPVRPLLVDVYDTSASGIVSPHDVALMGDSLITVDQKKNADEKVQIYKVWGDGPIACKDWEVLDTLFSDKLNGANRVVVQDAIAYVAGNSGDSVCAIEVNEQGKMHLQGIETTHDVQPCGIELGDDDLFVGAAEHVERFDLSDPIRPRSVDWLSVFDSGRPRHPKQRGLGDAHDLVYRDGLLYVTGQNDDSLAIIEI
jgi:hypothetical protein